MKNMYHVFFALFAASAAFATEVNLSGLTADYIAQDGDVLTGTLGGNYKISIANNAKVTLDNATINGVNDGAKYQWAGITCLGNCTIVLKGSNTVTGFNGDYPGIQAAKQVGEGEVYTLTIEGDGSLDASSNGHGAGIGGGYDAKIGNITITGGLIAASGGYDGAGIGSGLEGTSGAITISGGYVYATGGVGSAGIGGSDHGTNGAITISGGKVTAVGGTYAAGIGSGGYTTCGDITISGGEVEAMGGTYAAGIGSGKGSTCGKITITNGVTSVVATMGDDGPFSVYAGSGAGKVTIGGAEPVDYIAESRFVYVPRRINLAKLTDNYVAQDGDTLTGTLNGETQPYMISIANDAKVTLKNVTINGSDASSCRDDEPCDWAGITCLGNCTIVLRGLNTVKGFNYTYPGIQAAKRVDDGEEYTLTIEGSGSLNASSNGLGAGIGGGSAVDCGNITISGGKITATGGSQAAGIGGASDGTCGNITISGGEVTATGGMFAAGIGSGVDGTCGKITITNDVTKVVATKGSDAPYSVGKGSGNKAGFGTITIGGEEVDPIARSPYTFPVVPVDLATLTGDYEAQDGDILTGELNGDPDYPQIYKITIADGAKVTLRNAAIKGVSGLKNQWAGLTCLGNCTLVLEGSNTVKGFYTFFPGIQAAVGYTLTIEGEGSLDASSSGGAAGIGGGYTDGDGKLINCGNITISSGTVTAKGGQNAAGIGGGQEVTCGDITISGGEVIAMGGDCAAGIGSGYDGIGGDVKISGGKVTAMGGNHAAGIGSGYQGSSGDITITNDVTTKVVATKGKKAPYSIGAGDGEKSSAGTITIGGDAKDPIAKELFVFPYPTTLVHFETVGDKKYAIVDGDYSGEGALSIATDENVDKVIFERTFPVVEGDNNYSTIMFPFAISADKVGNVKQVFKFLGIDVDKQNRKVVAVEKVTTFEAYKPYLIQLKSEKTSISIDNTEPLVFKSNPTADGAYDVEQSEGYNKYGDYVFHGVVQTKTWGASDPDVLGTGKAAAYGFAGVAVTGISVGQFVKVGEGAFIKPFRAYIYKKPVPQAVKSNGAYVLRRIASIDDDIPDVMNVVVVDRKKDGSEQTTVIGQFNSRTGEIRLNRTKRTYDLKGRSVRDASRMAKGVYLKK